MTFRWRTALRIAILALGLLALAAAAGGYTQPGLLLHYINLQLC